MPFRKVFVLTFKIMLSIILSGLIMGGVPFVIVMLIARWNR